MPTIEISDQGQAALSFDLIDILTVIEPFSLGLEWYFMEFELGSFVGADQQNVRPSVIALWDRIQESKNGIRISWQELKDFARNVRQTDMALLLALRPGNEPPMEPLDLNSQQFDIVVQAVDFSFWAVTTRNDELIARLNDHFKSTQIVESTRRYH